MSRFSTFASPSLGGFLVLQNHKSEVLLWMDELLHHFETMVNHCLLVVTREVSFQGFLGGATCLRLVLDPEVPQGFQQVNHRLGKR